MKNLKILGIIALIAVMSFSFTACSGDTDSVVIITNNHPGTINFVGLGLGLTDGFWNHLNITTGTSQTFIIPITTPRDGNVQVRFLNHGIQSNSNRIPVRFEPLNGVYRFTLNADGFLSRTE